MISDNLSDYFENFNPHNPHNFGKLDKIATFISTSFYQYATLRLSHGKSPIQKELDLFSGEAAVEISQKVTKMIGGREREVFSKVTVNCVLLTRLPKLAPGDDPALAGHLKEDLELTLHKDLANRFQPKLADSPEEKMRKNREFEALVVNSPYIIVFVLSPDALLSFRAKKKLERRLLGVSSKGVADTAENLYDRFIEAQDKSAALRSNDIIIVAVKKRMQIALMVKLGEPMPAGGTLAAGSQYIVLLIQSFIEDLILNKLFQPYLAEKLSRLGTWGNKFLSRFVTSLSGTLLNLGLGAAFNAVVLTVRDKSFFWDWKEAGRTGLVSVCIYALNLFGAAITSLPIFDEMNPHARIVLANCINAMLNAASQLLVQKLLFRLHGRVVGKIVGVTAGVTFITGSASNLDEWINQRIPRNSYPPAVHAAAFTITNTIFNWLITRLMSRIVNSCDPELPPLDLTPAIVKGSHSLWPVHKDVITQDELLSAKKELQHPDLEAQRQEIVARVESEVAALKDERRPLLEVKIVSPAKAGGYGSSLPLPTPSDSSGKMEETANPSASSPQQALVQVASELPKPPAASEPQISPKRGPSVPAFKK